MDLTIILGIFGLLIAFGAGTFIVLKLLPSNQPNLESLTGRGSARFGTDASERVLSDSEVEEFKSKASSLVPPSTSDADMQKLRALAQKKRKKNSQVSLPELFFRAGMFSDQKKKKFYTLRVVTPIGTVPLMIFAFFKGGFSDPIMLIVAAFFGLALGYQFPKTLLERRIKKRNEDIMFYLPLVIEQIAIGVSSSLDIGPCLQRVVSMADERDTHNVVTELLRHAQFYVKSGASLEEAMTEVGRLSGHNELKHAFTSLAQVAKHGGEITRQLQELADAVAGQREVKIEEKIKKLELEATGPVALVFLGFLVILLVGFGLQIKGSF